MRLSKYTQAYCQALRCSSKYDVTCVLATLYMGLGKTAVCTTYQGTVRSICGLVSDPWPNMSSGRHKNDASQYSQQSCLRVIASTVNVVALICAREHFTALI